MFLVKLQAVICTQVIVYLFRNLHVVRLYCAIENTVAKCDSVRRLVRHIGKTKSDDGF
jgi:hypothetical protein